MKQLMLLGTILVGLLASPARAQQTQCVANVLAGGTVDAITIPLQPCALATNLLILTLAGANTVAQPTLKMAGFPAQNIYTAAGGAPGVGALPSAGTVILLTSTGTSWKILSNNAVNSWSTLQTFLAGINLSGASSPLQVGGSAGTSGKPLVSAGAGTTPAWNTLGVSGGGTGATSLTGLAKGSGTSAWVAATAGTDYVAPGTVTNFTAKQTFTGTSSNLATGLVNAAEPGTIAATAATGTINYDVCTQSILYYTTNASANWTLNLRCSSGTSLNTAMTTGDIVTVVHMVTQAASPFYNNGLQVDGNSVTPKCQAGSCPTSGNASGIDAYTYAIIKTGNAAFTILESQTAFK